MTFLFLCKIKIIWMMNFSKIDYYVCSSHYCLTLTSRNLIERWWYRTCFRWVDDATGLAPPCIAVLRSCHTLAASLTTIAGTVNSNTVPLEIVDVSAIIISDIISYQNAAFFPRLLGAYRLAWTMLYAVYIHHWTPDCWKPESQL